MPHVLWSSCKQWPHRSRLLERVMHQQNGRRLPKPGILFCKKCDFSAPGVIVGRCWRAANSWCTYGVDGDFVWRPLKETFEDCHLGCVDHCVVILPPCCDTPRPAAATIPSMPLLEPWVISGPFYLIPGKNQKTAETFVCPGRIIHLRTGWNPAGSWLALTRCRRLKWSG
jgi:hypothetical protein